MKNSSSLWPLWWVDAHIPPAPTPVYFPQRKAAMFVEYLLGARHEQCLTLHLPPLREQSLVITLIWQMKRQRLWEVKFLCQHGQKAGATGFGAPTFLTHQIKPSWLSPLLPLKTQFWVHLEPLMGGDQCPQREKGSRNHTANNGTGLR